jgi:hypothetical protein
MKVISYKYFSNQTDFENWQRETKPEIINISPIATNINVVNEYDNETKAKRLGSEATYSHAIFITFYKD